MPNNINFSRQSFLTSIPRPSPPLLLPKIHSANVPKSKAIGASSRLTKGKTSTSGKPNLATNSGMSEDDSRKTQKDEVSKMSKCKNCSQSPLTVTLEQGAKKRHFRWATDSESSNYPFFRLAAKGFGACQHMSITVNLESEANYINPTKYDSYSFPYLTKHYFFEEFPV